MRLMPCCLLLICETEVTLNDHFKLRWTPKDTAALRFDWCASLSPLPHICTEHQIKVLYVTSICAGTEIPN